MSRSKPARRSRAKRLARALVLSVTVALGVSPAPLAAAEGDTIQEVVVEGTERVEPGTVKSYMLIQDGDPFDQARIDRSLKSLYATGLFSDVTIDREGDKLIVRVVENPVINRIAFEGNQKIEDKTLESEITLRPRTIYTRTKVQSDVKRILTLYRRSGRFAATVEPKIIQLPQNRVDLVFEINEGPVTGVETIRFIGNKSFSDSDLREVVRTRQTRWWRFLATEDTYDPDRLALDRELLRRFYLSEGYADFRVQSAVAELSPDRENFYITFTIEEGERYRVGNVDVTTTLRGMDPQTFKDQLKFGPGDWYDATAVDKAADQLSQLAADQGYAFAEVRPRITRDPAQRTIDIIFEITEGPKAYVERIDITGNVRTMDKVIRREFRLIEGDAYNAAQLRRSKQRIENLDFFEKVEMDEQPGSAPDKANIKLNVQEKSTGSFSVGAGYSSGAGVLGDITLRERNLLGRGQDARVSVVIGQRQQQADLSFTEPYFLDRDIAAGVDLFYVRTDRQSQSAFDVDTFGGDLRAKYPLNERLTQGWQYTAKSSTIKNVPNKASEFIKQAEGAETYSMISHSLTYDRRDNIISPTEGYYAELNTDLAGLGGTAKFLRNKVEAGYYYPISERWVASLSGSAGYVWGYSGDVKILDRYFIGQSEIRGFEIDGIGPRSDRNDDALGAEIYYATSAQLSFPFGFLPEDLQIRGRVFTDVASAWKNPDSGGSGRKKVYDSSSPRLSAGVGVTWVSPFGPLGVDFGYPILKQKFDQTEYFAINFGTRF